MQRFARAQYTYCFDKDAPAIGEIESGDRVVFETHDSSTGRIKRREDLGYYLSVRKVRESNPACGPLAVRGALPGDGLDVLIEDITLVPPGILRFTPGLGILADAGPKPGIIIADVDGNTLLLDNGIRLPARPMVGVIGTALPDRVVYTADPDINGSNMDCNSIAEGTVVHLPVWVPGARLALGDVHAAMGDAEATGGAIEISADVTVRVEVVKNAGWEKVWWETPDSWITYGHGETLEIANREAAAGMAALLARQFQIPYHEGFMLISAYGDVRIGQAANCGLDVTSWVAFPKVAYRTGG